jgi:hypothetical protein
MTLMRALIAVTYVSLSLLATLSSGAAAQDPLKTPLPDETLRLMANHLSGQLAFNNLV